MSWWNDLLRKAAGCQPTQPPQPPQPPMQCRVPLKYAYYGTQDSQIQQTYSHVNLVHVGAWGDWVTPAGRAALLDTIIAFMHEAVGRDLLCMPTLDFCLFTQTNPRRSLDPETSRAYLDEFFTRIRNEGLLDSVIAYYLIDEPNIPGNDLSDQDVNNAIQWARAVAGFYWNPMNPLPMVSIYGWVNNGNHWPGVQYFDWVGFDNYGAPIFSNGMYNKFTSQLDSGQKTILVPGGGDPWRENPQPFYDHAQTDNRVIMIMPFKWFGTDGIGQNGTAATYEAIGQRVVETNP